MKALISGRAVARSAAFTAALIACLAVTPSALSFTPTSQTGTYGDYGVPDNPQVGQEGARCFYVNDGLGGSRLKRVRVQAPVIWGAYANSTWVGWRLKILRSTNDGASYQVYYKSPVWKDRANDADFADGFTYGNWYPAGGQPQARIKVQVTLFWYEPGTSNKVEGKVVGTDDSYVQKYKGQVPVSTSTYCLAIEA